MKKKILTLFFLILTAFIIFPYNTNAQVNTTKRFNISETGSIITNELSLIGINFNDYSLTSTQAYGISGQIQNHTNNSLNTNITVKYYNSNFELVSQNTINKFITAQTTTSYIQMSNLNTLNTKYTVSDIMYYELTLTAAASKYDTNINENNLTPSLDINNQYRDYVINAYDINITVNENNTLDIVETITAYFNKPKHGIFRKIPLKNTVKRLDGTTTKNRARVTNVKVDNEFTTSKDSSTYEIKIGSANYTLTGEQKYIISYNYNLGKDPMKEYDEFYFNIIGPEWDTVIGNITFTITMPKEFDATKLGFSSGNYGSTVNDDIKYEVNGNVITGEYNNILNINQGLTIRLELDEGYFVGAGFKMGFEGYLLFIIPTICLIISILLWRKYGNDDTIVETIEFYPPEGMNSLQVGQFYKGMANSEDVVSLIVYLANKGYLKIEENNSSRSFKLTKLKNYDGIDLNEKIFFENLFSKNKTTVTAKELTNKFYRTINKILTNVNSKKYQHMIFEKSSLNKKIFIIILIIISLIVTIAVPTIEFSEIGMVFLTILIVSFYIPFYATIFTKGMDLAAKIVITIFLLFHSGAFMMALPITQAIIAEPFYLLTTLYGLACVIGMLIIIGVMPKRTPYGNQLLGRIAGFKTFLKTAEKSRLEALIMENPNYFYDILPYTYVLGVSDKWIENFESIAIQEPNWYSGKNTFSVNSFGKFMDSTITNANRTMTSSPSSGGSGSSGGGSSGGGSSGGGSGGGGGGSW